MARDGYSDNQPPSTLQITLPPTSYTVVGTNILRRENEGGIMSDRIIPVNYTTRRISDEARQRMSEGGRRGKEKQLAKKYANLKKNHPEKYAEVMAKLEKIRQEKQVGKIQD